MGFFRWTVGYRCLTRIFVGPMRAARMFAEGVKGDAALARIQIELFGSLGATGKGYSTDKAVILGLMGESPESVNTGVISDCLERLEHSRRLVLCGMREIYFDSQVDLVFHRRKALPYHPNGMCCRALDVDARYSG